MNVNWGTLLPIIIYFVLMYFIGVFFFFNNSGELHRIWQL